MSSYEDSVRRSRYAESQEYRGPSQELVPRSSRAENELSVEPYYERDHRARSAGPYYEDEYYGRYDESRGYERGIGRHKSKKSSSKFYMQEERYRRRVLSKEQKIMAALAGAALLAGGKELYDRHEAKEEGTTIHRNPLASAALGAAGALAGYQGAELYSKQVAKHKSKRVVSGRDGRVEQDYWTDESSNDDQEKKHNSSFLKSAIAAAGLGKMVKSLAGGGDDRSEHSYHSNRSRSSNRGRSRSSSSSRSRFRSESGVDKIQKAAIASLLAGASEAFRIYKEPGSWKGEKTKRIITAAISAGSIDAAHDSKHSKRSLLESVMGGLIANRALRGPKKDIEEDRYGRSRSRSRARSEGGKRSSASGPVAAILGALAGKKLQENSRSRSRSRRDSSADSRDSRRSKKSMRERSRSAVRKLLAKTGLEDDDDKKYDDRHGHDDDYYYEDYRSRRSRRHPSHSDERDRSRGGGEYNSASDLGYSDEDERQYKKKKGKSITYHLGRWSEPVPPAGFNSGTIRPDAGA